MSFSNADYRANLQDEMSPLITDVQPKPNQTKPNQTKPNQTKQNTLDYTMDELILPDNSVELLARVLEEEGVVVESPVVEKDAYVIRFEEFQGRVMERQAQMQDEDYTTDSGSESDKISRIEFAEKIGRQFIDGLVKKDENVDDVVVLADIAREVKSEVERKKIHRAAMFKELRVLLPQLKRGVSVALVRKQDGKKLNYEERSAILRILPKEFDPFKSGRFRKYCGEGRFQDTGYMCNTNLAGRFYISTADGVMVPVPIMGRDIECGHKTCVPNREIRSGGESDRLVLVIPEIYSDCNRGILSEHKGGKLKFWQDNYHEAVVATTLMLNTMTPVEVSRIIGGQFSPTSRFCTAMVFMTRMLGLKDIGFLKYAPNKTMFDNMLEGVLGAPNKFAEFWSAKGRKSSLRTPKASWALHELCKLKYRYPDVSIPFRYYLENLSELTVKGEATVLALCRAFEDNGEVTEVLNSEIDVSDTTDVSVFENNGALWCKVDGKMQELSDTAATVFHGRLRNIVPEGVFDLKSFEVKTLNCASPYTYERLLMGKTITYKKLRRGKWVQKEVVGLADIPEEPSSMDAVAVEAANQEEQLKPLSEYSAHESLVMLLRGFKPTKS